jgi:hypothetical protein
LSALHPKDDSVTLAWLKDKEEDEELGEGEGGFSQGFAPFSPSKAEDRATAHPAKAARQATHSNAKAATEYLMKLLTTSTSPCFAAWSLEMYEHVK